MRVGCQLFVMVRAVQFNDQGGAGTIEIHNELADHMLAAKVSPAELVLAKLLPENPFLWRGFVSKPTGEFPATEH